MESKVIELHPTFLPEGSGVLSNEPSLMFAYSIPMHLPTEAQIWTGSIETTNWKRCASTIPEWWLWKEVPLHPLYTLLLVDGDLRPHVITNGLQKRLQQSVKRSTAMSWATWEPEYASHSFEVSWLQLEVKEENAKQRQGPFPQCLSTLSLRHRIMNPCRS